MNKIECPTSVLYTYKITCRYMCTLKDSMKNILKVDPDAEFRINGGHSFKVRTHLNPQNINMLAVFDENISKVRKVWFFNLF